MSTIDKQQNAVVVNDIKKTFRLPHENHSGLKQLLINLTQKKRLKGYEVQRVLRGVSFEVKKGDFFGIVGRNGSGKSTLLKLLAGIYTPDSGAIQTDGSIVPFIELGVGFNPELTGRENVFLNGALLGFSRDEMKLMYDDIVEFAELERFMDQKLKNYSSGMQVRLAFSIAIQAKGDILILDEVLAVGDEAFQRKCNEYFESVRKDKSKTIILVTHSMDSVRRYCNRAVLLNDGQVVKFGSPDKVANAYSKMFIDEQIAEIEKSQEKKVINKKLSDVSLNRVHITQNNIPTKTVQFRENFSLELELTAGVEHQDLTMGIHFFDQSGRDILAITTKQYGDFHLKKGRNNVRFDIQNIFTDSTYYINMAIEENTTKKLLFQNHELSPFTIVGLNLSKNSKHSLTHPDVSINFD